LRYYPCFIFSYKPFQGGFGDTLWPFWGVMVHKEIHTQIGAPWAILFAHTPFWGWEPTLTSLGQAHMHKRAL
jgi:hypothetical protein